MGFPFHSSYHPHYFRRTTPTQYHELFHRRRAWLATLRRVPTNESLLLQAVVDFGGRTPEGDIIVAVLPAWEEIVRLIGSDPHLMFEIDPRKWEEIIAANYEQHGFDEVVLTPRSGDLGRDVIAVKRGLWSVRIIESVKRFAPDRPVAADDVRALLGVLSADQNASKAVISTTSDFAPRIVDDPLIRPFLPHRLELINGSQLVSRLQSADRRFPS